MIKRFKVIVTTLIISIFAAQSVLACACEVDMPISGSHHDHHQMMDHDMTKFGDHECESNCHLSFTETEGTDFLLTAPEKPKQDAAKYALTYRDLIKDFLAFERAPPTVLSAHKTETPRVKTTLFAQGMLLRI